MRTTALALAVIGLSVAGCSDYGTGPDKFLNTYALARIGTAPLPAPLGNGATTLVVADTLRLLVDKARSDQPFVRQISVLKEPNRPPTKSQNDFNYTVTGSFLTYDTCPIGSFCAASLVYAPRTYQIVGDSLFEVVAVGLNKQPYVYGRISAR